MVNLIIALIVIIFFIVALKIFKLPSAEKVLEKANSNFEKEAVEVKVLSSFTKEEQKDLRIYAFVRCLLETAMVDGNFHPGQTSAVAQFSELEQKKLSEPYHLESKLGKFIWEKKKHIDKATMAKIENGELPNFKSYDRNNLISVIKTNTKSGLENLFEKIIITSIADGSSTSKEVKHIANLYANIYNLSYKEGLVMYKVAFKALKDNAKKDN